MATGFLIIVATLFAVFSACLISHDIRARRAGKRYCEDNALELIETKVWKNAYGLYFRYNGKRLYARYRFSRKDGICWVHDSPLEIVQQQKTLPDAT